MTETVIIRLPIRRANAIGASQFFDGWYRRAGGVSGSTDGRFLHVGIGEVPARPRYPPIAARASANRTSAETLTDGDLSEDVP